MHTFNMLSPRWVANSPVLNNVPERVVINAAIRDAHLHRDGQQSPSNPVTGFLHRIRVTWHRILRNGTYRNYL